MSKKSSIETLSPEAVEVTIGDETFVQLPLRIDKLSDAMQEIIDAVLGGGRENLLDQLVGDGAENAAPMLLNLLIGIPKSLPKIVALCLDIPKKETYIRDHIKARPALAIVKTFIEQNEIQELLQDFFGLMGDLGMDMNQSQNGQKNLEKLTETVEAIKKKETAAQTDSDSP